MSPAQVIQKLKGNLPLFENLFAELSSEEILWKRNPQKWCPLEMICHLYDEELEDFRIRVRYCLEKPETTLPPIDPVAWVKDRKYLEQDYEQKRQAFFRARQNSIEWLESLEQPNWDSGSVHPKFGPRTARFFLNNWLAHDYLHIRQMTRNRYDFLTEKGDEIIEYAGNWVLE